MIAPAKRVFVTVAAVAIIAAAALVIRFTTAVRAPLEAPPSSAEARPARTLMFSILDSGGRPIDDLRPEEVSVFDDGVPQVVTLQHGPVAIGEAGAETQAKPRKHVLVVLDDLHMNEAGMRRVPKLCEALFAALLSEKDKVAVIATGPAGLAVDFTTDKAAVLKELSGTSPMGATNVDTARKIESQQDHVALATVYGLVTRLGAVEGQKTILWLGGRYSFDVPSPADVARLLTRDAFSQPHDATEPRALEMKLVQLAAAANAAAAVIHAFDVESNGTEDSRRVEGPRSALASLAELTGGRSTVGLTDTQRGLPAIQAATDRYYRVAYAPRTAVAQPRHLREVRLVVRRPGLSLDEKRWVLAGM